MEIEAVQELEIETEKVGPQGYSAYEVAVQNGFEGTEEEWLASLKGEDGADGESGPQGPQGLPGTDGTNATINGVSAINIAAGENITLVQEDGTLTINSTGGGTRDYATLTNKPSINNVELNGNKSLSDLGVGTYDKPASGIPKTDLASDVQASLNKANTALQSETYTGTITGITMNGASKGTSGVVDLGTVITEHQDISGKQDVLTAGDNITINNNVISANIKLPDVPVLTIYEQYTSNIQTTLQISSANLAIINDFIKKENVTTEKGTNFILDINGSDLEDTNKLYPYRYLVFIKIPKRTGTINTSMAYAYQAICVRIDVWGINENKTILTNSFNTSVNLNENGYVTNFVSVTKTVKADMAFLTEASSLSKSNTTSYTPTGDYNPATKKYVDDNIPAPIQYSTMPTASADYLGKIVQYTGITNANYTNGYFYIGITDGAAVPTYSWSNVDVQNMPDLSEYLNNSEIIAYTLGSINLSLNTNGTISLNNEGARNAVVSAINKHIDKEPFMLCFIDSNNNMAIMFIKRITKQYGSNVNYYPQFLYLSANGGTIWFGANRLVVTFNATTGLVNNVNNISNSTYGTKEIIKADKVLTKTNTDTYIPTDNYHPATKKYVDDSIAAAVGNINTILATLTTPTSGGGE